MTTRQESTEVLRFILVPQPGHCTNCGKMTRQYDLRYKWRICDDCDSDDTAWKVADHVTGIEDWEGDNV